MTILVLIKEIHNGYCQYSWFCFLKEQLSEALHRRRRNTHTLLKTWTLVKTLSSLAHNWNSDRQVFFPSFSLLFYCNIFLKWNAYLQVLSQENGFSVTVFGQEA